jgi:predicted outer membrane protein
MIVRHLVVATAILALSGAHAVNAQTPAAPAAKPAAATAKPRTAKSIECSKQADAKGLHGKERKKFRNECKRG